jgi:hypothetical protein
MQLCKHSFEPKFDGYLKLFPLRIVFYMMFLEDHKRTWKISNHAIPVYTNSNQYRSEFLTKGLLCHVFDLNTPACHSLTLHLCRGRAIFY